MFLLGSWEDISEMIQRQFFILALTCSTTSISIHTTQAVSDVDIDEAGVYKYILIRVTSGGASKYVVRGYESCEYHGSTDR